MRAIESRRSAFRELHANGTFVIPNPWDIGSARYLGHMGFKALATTSAGYAFARGLPDMDVGIDDMLAHIAEMVEASEKPVNADFGAAYADEPEGVAVNVARCVETGVAGLSVEDATGRDDEPLYPFEVAVARIAAARAAIDRTQSGVLLTARAECFLTRHPDPLGEAIRRLEAYAEAGADCLYAPGLHTAQQVEAVVAAVAPKPVNVLATKQYNFTVAELTALGVRRISVGSSLALAAWGGFLAAARSIAEAGRFDGFPDAPGYGEINSFFIKDSTSR